MRIWDTEPALLCRQRLLGEHRELHAEWNVLTRKKKGYSRHPGTLRWAGGLGALYRVHEAMVAEMVRRGYNHRSPLDEALATGRKIQDVFVNTPEEQIAILRARKCNCMV